MTEIEDMKKAVSITIPIRDLSMFRTNCSKEYGYEKGSLSKGFLEAVRDYNAKKLAKMPEAKREAFFEEVRDGLRGEIEKIRQKESVK